MSNIIWHSTTVSKDDRITHKNHKAVVLWYTGLSGSGKSTILNQIDLKFDIGYYINADDIEKQLKSTQNINLSNYGISNFNNNKFNSLRKNHSIIKKAEDDGYKIDLYFTKGLIINPDKNSHSYEAAFIADILRQEILLTGKKFAFNKVSSNLLSCALGIPTAPRSSSFN